MRSHFSFRAVLGALFLSTVVWMTLSPTAGSAATNPALRRYPYLTDTVGSYATINWATDLSDTAGAVRYGKAGVEACTAHYVAATKTRIVVNGVAEYQWKAQLDLEPGVQYCYRVYLGTSPVNEVDLLGSDASPTFRTQEPAGSTQSFSFVVFGDWGQVDASGGNPYQARLMSLIASSGARFALTTGDNGYPSGTQAVYGDLLQRGENISAVFGLSGWKSPGALMSIFPAIGNHGFTSPDVNHPHLINWPQDRVVSMSEGRYRKETYCCVDGSASGSYPSTWYAFDAGPARFYMLEAAWTEANSGTATAYKVDYDYHWAPGTAQYQWLKADLASHPSVLKFAFFHYPLYSDNPQESTDTFLQGNNGLEGLLKQSGVNIAFTGHAHIYERNLASAAGIPNYITGGGGATPGTLGTCTALDAYAIKFTTSGDACGSAPVPTSAGQLYHYLKVTVSGTSVTVTPINSLGQSFDVQTYDFASAAESVPPTSPANLAASTVSGTQINLSWSASSDNAGIRGYSIYRNGLLINTLDKDTLRYSDVDLLPATTYTYTVDAYDGSGNHSALSTPALATTDSTATYTFVPVADTYVASDLPATNYGLSETLRINSSPTDRSYLRFNVHDTSGTVTRAILRLFVTLGSSAGYQLHTLDRQTWEEGQATYTDVPVPGSVIDSSGGFSAGTWTTIDVTSQITGNGVYDFALTTTGSSIDLVSRDASSRQPELIVETAGVPQEADLSLQKSINSKTPAVSTNVVFTLTVTNQGPEIATGVEVKDQLPSGFTFVSSNPSRGAYNSLNGIWSVGTLAVNASETLQITATVNVSGSYTNTAEISASQLVDPDSTPGNGKSNEDDQAAVAIRPGRDGDPGAAGGSANDLLTGFLIPVTGYAPGVRTALSAATKAEFDSTSLSIKIPELSVDIPIVGIPYQHNTWNIDWLWNQAGWLQGTAYPTSPGNSVITGHLVTADGKPGPFYNLRLIKPGNYIFVDNGGFRYVYKVMTRRFVKPSDESILDHQENPWLTLVTCDSYDEKTRTYLRRLVVQARLVSISETE